MPDATHITQIGTAMVPVSDQDAAIEFYTSTLGFELRSDTPFGNGNRWVEVAPPGAATTIALVQPMQGEPVGIDTRFAYSTSDIDADHAALQAAGVDVEEIMRMGDPVPPMFFFRDPDSNRSLIVQSS